MYYSIFLYYSIFQLYYSITILLYYSIFQQNAIFTHLDVLSLIFFLPKLIFLSDLPELCYSLPWIINTFIFNTSRGDHIGNESQNK